jgi:hypothetical protein
MATRKSHREFELPKDELASRFISPRRILRQIRSAEQMRATINGNVAERNASPFICIAIGKTLSQ